MRWGGLQQQSEAVAPIWGGLGERRAAQAAAWKASHAITQHVLHAPWSSNPVISRAVADAWAGQGIPVRLSQGLPWSVPPVIALPTRPGEASAPG